VAFTRTLLHKFFAAYANDSGLALVAALPDSDVARRLSHVSGLDAVESGYAAPLWAIAKGGNLSEARPIVLPYKEHVAKIPLPPGMNGRSEAPFGVSDMFVCRVDHWVHILRVNQSALAAHWAELGGSLGGKLWYLWRALRGFPWTRGRLAAAIHQIHRKAKVHHTAHVELSVIEAGAEIGPNAIVKSSWIGKGANIGDGAVVNGTVVGERAYVSSGSCVTGAVLYPQSFAAQQKMQLCVFGEGAVAFTGSYFYDLNFAGNVRVLHRGKVVDGGDPFTSVCMGPWSRVCGGVWIASGREVPPNALILQSPDTVLNRIDDALASTRMTAVGPKGLLDVGTIPDNKPGPGRTGGS
jgi:hypothetical protein